MDRKLTCLAKICASLLVSTSPLFSAGCEDQRRHSAASGLTLPEARPPIAANAGPAEVTRAFLEAIREAQHARERGFGRVEQKQGYETAMATLRSLAASRAIYDAVRSGHAGTVPKDITEDAAVTLTLESWVSMVAYYVDGFLFDTLVATTPRPDGAALTKIQLEAARPEDAVRLRQLEAASATSAPAVGGNEATAPARVDALRAEAVALRPPLNVPVRAMIELTLVQGENGWLVSRMTIGPGSPTLPAAAPALQPRASTIPARPPAPPPNGSK